MSYTVLDLEAAVTPQNPYVTDDRRPLRAIMDDVELLLVAVGRGLRHVWRELRDTMSGAPCLYLIGLRDGLRLAVDSRRLRRPGVAAALLRDVDSFLASRTS
eukprot:TRINITY_DN73424_c0_g1_i1.p1 TRINITY_DN73424_c0_g1~~TRINITY_DN73424_c0_g1_i1.p1  ORF type:complete len:102 (-),score=9.37 TRINITY_DN73424_c0_g1_i1:47-352(-)